MVSGGALLTFTCLQFEGELWDGQMFFSLKRTDVYFFSGRM